MSQFKINDELISKIKRLIENDDKERLISIVSDFHYADLAEVFELIEINEIVFLFKILINKK